ncbi:MAG: fibronectin type III domain-containing protein [Bdellovibrionales bacterium]|nr:fibronectin type III domain-containing protein [Bdellovibrionales bacterium]
MGLKFVFIFTLFLFVTSCVGTIENTKVKNNKNFVMESPILSFEGLQKASAVAHNKVELFFFPVEDDPEKIIYEIYYDGLDKPITLFGLNLEPDYQGYLRYTVSGLKTSGTYSFEVIARNLDTDEVSNEKNEGLTIKLFANNVCDFWGVQDVVNLEGRNGLDSLRIVWAWPTKKGSFLPDAYDPYLFEVILVDLSELSPADINNDNFQYPLRQLKYVDPTNPDKISVEITGLTEDTEYAVQVRCIHHDYISNSSDESYKKEENTKYIKTRTLSSDISNIEFNVDSLSVMLPGDEKGFSSVELDWENAVGPFDHYRVYYKEGKGKVTEQDISSSCEKIDTWGGCKQVNYSESSTIIASLNYQSEYHFIVVLCITNECTRNSRIVSNERVISIEPQVVDFKGINEVVFETSLEALDTVRINIAPTSSLLGVLDGLIVYYLDDTKGEMPLNHPTIKNSTTLNLLEFDYRNADTLLVTGINPFEGKPYCFKVLPYLVKDFATGEIKVSETNDVSKCVIPQVVAPSNDDFRGVEGNCLVADGQIIVNWNKPLNGVYFGYKVFVGLKDTSFSFGAAVNEGSSYQVFDIPSYESSFSLYMDSAGVYEVGVLTYVNILGEYIYSDFNDSIVKCTVE